MRMLALMLISVFALAACDQPNSPSAVPPQGSAPPPQTGAPPVPTGPFTATGIVTEWTPSGVHPLSGANVNAWVGTSGFSYSYMWANGPRLSNAAGEYELTSLPQGAELLLQVYKEGYVQQCAAPPLIVSAPLRVDLQLVARTNLSASAAAVGASASGFRLISGVVYELTSDGRRSAPDAFVDYEPIEDFPAATTRTDTAGRFLLCGIPEMRTVTIGASIGVNRYAYQRVPPGPNANIEIEIK